MTAVFSSSQDNTIKKWDVETGAEQFTLKEDTNYAWSVAIGPEGSLLASGSADETVGIWSLPKAK